MAAATGTPGDSRKPLYKVLYEALAVPSGPEGNALDTAGSAPSASTTQTEMNPQTATKLEKEHEHIASGRPGQHGTAAVPGESKGTPFDASPVTNFLASSGSMVDSPDLWRLATKAKDALPNGARLENLTWRAMHLTRMKREQEKAKVQGALAPMFDDEQNASSDIAKSHPGTAPKASPSYSDGTAVRSIEPEGMDWSAASAEGHFEQESVEDMRKHLLAQIGNHQVTQAALAAALSGSFADVSLTLIYIGCGILTCRFLLGAW